MKREIKFRGKHKSGQWFYGDLIRNLYLEGGVKIECGIIEDWDVAEVIPETVGQYVGLKDKNDREIYEGDIIQLADGNKGVVMFESGKFFHTAKTEVMGLLYWNEVIGNIYENPELLTE